MASHLDTSEYQCGLTMGSYPEQYIDPNVNQSAYNCQYIPVTPVPVLIYHQQPRPCHNMAKRHRAQITFVPSSSGNFKAIIKRKRKRTMFTTEQVQALEDIFKTKQYINRDDRQVIANQLQLSDKAIKVWFQNRRFKNKRIQDQDSQEQEETSNPTHSEEEKCSLFLERLDSIESKIHKKTNEHGFVTLDGEVMGDLVNVIDDCLSKNSTNVPEKIIAEGNSSPLYEPISPASACDSNDSEGSSVFWRPTEPSETLQILFDLQTMLSF